MNLYTDAARDGSVTGVAWKIVAGQETITGKRYIFGNFTSMEAEYFALLDGLRHARRFDTDEVIAHTDCKPLIDKMQSPESDWYDRKQGCIRLLNKFDSWELCYIPRDLNSAHDLAYSALEDGREA